MTFCWKLSSLHIEKTFIYKWLNMKKKRQIIILIILLILCWFAYFLIFKEHYFSKCRREIRKCHIAEKKWADIICPICCDAEWNAIHFLNEWKCAY